MNAAVAQLAVVQIGFLCSLSCNFCYSSHSLALLFRFRNLLNQNLGNIWIFVQEVIHLFVNEIAHIFVDAHAAVRLHGERAELDFSLALEHRFFHVERDGCNESVTDVAVVEVLVREVLDCLGNVLFESRLMRSAKGSVLSVYERVILFAALV